MTSNWICNTDGGCRGNPGPSSWGSVVIAPDGTITEGSGFLGRGTNQAAELSAAIHGLEMTPVGASVLVISDSQYVLKGLTEWRRGWESRGFTTASGDPVKNLPIWMRLYAVADQRKISTQWVRGHSGDVHNERCDALARQAIDAALNPGASSAILTPALTTIASAAPSLAAVEICEATDRRALFMDASSHFLNVVTSLGKGGLLNPLRTHQQDLWQADDQWLSESVKNALKHHLADHHAIAVDTQNTQEMGWLQECVASLTPVFSA